MRLSSLVLRGPQCVVAFQRELRIDGDGARRVRQVQHAVRALVVAQRFLKFVGRRRQRRLHQILQLDFTERAPRLPVGKDILQLDDLG